MARRLPSPRCRHPQPEPGRPLLLGPAPSGPSARRGRRAGAPRGSPARPDHRPRGVLRRQGRRRHPGPARRGPAGAPAPTVLVDVGCGYGPIAVHPRPAGRPDADGVGGRRERAGPRPVPGATPRPTGWAIGCAWSRPTRCPPTWWSTRSGPTRRSGSARRRCTTCSPTGWAACRPAPARPRSWSRSTSAPTRSPAGWPRPGLAHRADRVAGRLPDPRGVAPVPGDAAGRGRREPIAGQHRAQAAPPRVAPPGTAARSALLLDSVATPYNVGSILRTAAALRVDDVWLCGQTADRDPRRHPEDRPRLAAVPDLPPRRGARRGRRRGRGRRLPGGRHRAGRRRRPAPPRSTSPASVCLAVGHEDRGLTAAVLAGADQLAFIPQLGRIGSLNVATATGSPSTRSAARAGPRPDRRRRNAARTSRPGREPWPTRSTLRPTAAMAVPITIVDSFTDRPVRREPRRRVCAARRARAGRVDAGGGRRGEPGRDGVRSCPATTATTTCAGSRPRSRSTCAATPPSPAPTCSAGRPVPHPQRPAHLHARAPTARSRWTCPATPVAPADDPPDWAAGARPRPGRTACRRVTRAPAGCLVELATPPTRPQRSCPTRARLAAARAAMAIVAAATAAISEPASTRCAGIFAPGCRHRRGPGHRRAPTRARPRGWPRAHRAGTEFARPPGVAPRGRHASAWRSGGDRVVARRRHAPVDRARDGPSLLVDRRIPTGLPGRR